MRFLPREEKFFALFLDQVKYINEAADLLLHGAKTGNGTFVEIAEKIHTLENRADEVAHNIFVLLNQTFITPIDPEDIYSLASHLDDVMDAIEDGAYRLAAYEVGEVPPVVVEVCQYIVLCTRSLTAAFSALHADQKLIEHCIEINRIEDVVDNLVRKAVQDLFATETNAVRIIKLKEIYEYLEQTTDFCEDVANALESVVVKNS